MIEDFKADPREIAGLGRLVAEIGDDISRAATFVGQEGRPAEWLRGPIIDDLLMPLHQAAECTQQRMGSIGSTTSTTGAELNKAAWLYSDQEKKNYDALNNHTFLGPVGPGRPNTTSADVEAPGFTEAYSEAASYAKPEEFKLEKPQANKEDTVALIAEVAPVLGDMNETIKSITRTAGNEIDPLGKCLEPIPGNWNEVRRIGEAYKAAGNALESSGKNLEAGLSRIDPKWDGKAALSFNDWANRQIAAMKWEGPVGRVVSDVLGVVADEIRGAIKTVLQKLWGILESQIDFTSVKGIFKTIGKKIPIVGQVYEIVDLGRKLFTIVTEALKLVNHIRILVDKVNALLDFIKDPLNKLKDKAQQKLDDTIAPFNDALAKASKKVAVTADLARIAQVNSTLDRPQAGYDVGSGTTPWDDA
ncbi:hypothetical protein ACFYTQ_11895 [Nocardia sp. NPDC004068]|uniref:hypothetical protein n=1 Tax=Nocardia sp. NPDC004068 TaxID=3364303 RepID=UPI00369A3B56